LAVTGALSVRKSPDNLQGYFATSQFTDPPVVATPGDARLNRRAIGRADRHGVVSTPRCGCTLPAPAGSGKLEVARRSVDSRPGQPQREADPGSQRARQLRGSAGFGAGAAAWAPAGLPSHSSMPKAVPRSAGSGARRVTARRLVSRLIQDTSDDFDMARLL